MRFSHLHLVLAVVVFSAVPRVALGQQKTGVPPQQQVTQPTPASNPPFTNDPFGSGMGRGTLVVTVANEQGLPLDGQALVKVSSETAAYTAWGTTQGRSQAQFDTLAPGDYEIEVSAAGFKTTTQPLTINTRNQITNILIRLQLDSSGDSAALNTKPGQLLAPKAQKEAEKGVASLKTGNLNDAQKHLDAAFKLAPTNADVAFLLGYLYLQRNDKVQAKSYFEKAISFNPDHTRALTSLGQLFLADGDYKGATEPLEKAVAVDPGHWQAHWELADAYLHQNRLEPARQEAELAIKSGKSAANGAELVLADALVGLGKSKEAIEAYQAYLVVNPNSPVAASVRDEIAKLQATH